MAKTPDMAATRWRDRVSAAGSAYAQGCAAFQGNPAAMAAAQADYWSSQVANSKQKFIDRLNNPAAGARWKTNTQGVGRNNYQSGATKGYEKVLSNFTAHWGVYMAAKDAARAIPKVSGSNNTQRVDAAINALKQGFGRK